MRLLLLDLVDEVVDRLAHLALRLAEPLTELADVALAAPLGLELRIVHELAGLFLDVALRLLGLATNLVAVHAPLPFPDRESSKKPARSEKKMCRADASGRLRAVPLHV